MTEFLSPPFTAFQFSLISGCVLFVGAVIGIVTSSIVCAILYRIDTGYWPRLYTFKFWE